MTRLKVGPVWYNRMQVSSAEVKVNDLLVCIFTEFTTIVKVEERGNIVELYVNETTAHVHNRNEVLEIARPEIAAN